MAKVGAGETTAGPCLTGAVGVDVKAGGRGSFCLYHLHFNVDLGEDAA